MLTLNRFDTISGGRGRMLRSISAMPAYVETQAGAAQARGFSCFSGVTLARRRWTKSYL